VTNTNSSAIDSIAFNIYASITGMPAANQPVGALSGFSPQLAADSSSGPIPEFSTTVNVPASPTNLFTISPCPAISGQVTLFGSGMSGAAMALSGSQSGAPTTNSSGNYIFAVPPGGTYTITPSLNGYNFIPPSRTFDNLSGSQTGNFIAQFSTPSLKTLYDFPGGSGGAYPHGAVAIGGGGLLYGTTTADGASNHGIVFSLTVAHGSRRRVDRERAEQLHGRQRGERSASGRGNRQGWGALRQCRWHGVFLGPARISRRRLD